MTLMLSELYDAPRTAEGVTEESARKAAAAVAAAQAHCQRRELALAHIQASVTLITWISGANLALSAVLLLQVFTR